jgi:hypothetical protein
LDLRGRWVRLHIEDDDDSDVDRACSMYGRAERFRLSPGKQP